MDQQEAFEEMLEDIRGLGYNWCFTQKAGYRFNPENWLVECERIFRDYAEEVSLNYYEEDE
jgi:hypothetical protein